MQARYEFANILRGVAALSVVASHFLGAFWVVQPVVSGFTGLAPLQGLEQPAVVRLAIATPVNYGSFGVGLFFVISGFVIPMSLMRYDARAFLVGRALRIYPTFWAGLACTIAAVAISAEWFGGGYPFSVKDAILHALPPLRVLAHTKPLDGIVWTLEIEIFFYLLCAALAGAIARGRLSVACAPFAIFAVWILAFCIYVWPPAGYEKAIRHLYVAATYAPFLILMFVGVALNFRQRGLIGRPAAALWAGACLAMFTAAWATRFIDMAPGANPVADAIDLPSYLGAVAVFVLCMAFQRWFTRGPLLDFFADISYPLYVVHGVVGYAALQVMIGRGVDGVLSLVVVFAAVVAISFAIHALVENPTHVYGQNLARRLAARKRASEAAIS